MKRYILFLPLALLLLFPGCSTAPEGEMPSPEEIPPEPTPVSAPFITETPDKPEQDLPLPVIEFSLTIPQVPAPLTVSESAGLPLPVYQAPRKTPVPATDPSLPETGTQAIPGKFPEESKPVVKAPEPVQEKPAPAAKKTEEITYRREETLTAGEAGVVALDGTDWIFLRVADGTALDYKDRTSGNGKTLFSYTIPGEGTWILLFQRQDHSSGETELAEITIRGENPSPTPVPETEATERPADLVQAEERLREIEENPERVEETLGLLEFLMDAASDDETLAGYYYRMARTLEMNSLYQDLKRAYDTYKYIEDTFFLTDYYEKALERIRFLDRHFFKLR